ncbi:protein NRT1/ PTR FAMILY 2.13-like [Typha angustifolia]|uniref:protein NRT1/ PTR FAMILY 2.13-like n=1 Tax=Typha angustifolia TaxID=59011 RepID=UPI003C2B47F4
MKSRMRSWVGSVVSCVKCSPFLEQQPLEPKGVEEGDSTTLEETRKPAGWKCVPYIIGNETFERVASTAITANFTVYLVKQFHMKQVAAANASNIFVGTTNFAPLLGAFLSDAYWGRFRTLAYACVASLVGMLFLTLISSIPQLHPPSCSESLEISGQCAGPSHEQIGILILALALLSLGAGGVRPCSLPFGVDQFDGDTEHGRRGLISFFNWYYCTSTAAVVVAMTAVVFVQDSVSWAIGFSIPTGLMALSTVLFFLGTRSYIYVPPGGSVFSGVAQVFIAAVRKRRLQLPAAEDAEAQEAQLYHGEIKKTKGTMRLPLTLQFRCLNKAAIKCEKDIKGDGSPVNPWRLCSVQQVEEVKCLLRIIPIWASGIVCFVALAQQWTFAALQSFTMDRHIGSHFQVPPGSFGIIALIALTLFIPIYDRLIVPIARSFTGIESGLTLLQRQGVGLAISVSSMVVAGLVEEKRRRSALTHGGAYGAAPLSAFWLAPQLILMGIAEAFNAVGQIEFYNRQFPEQMQSIAGSLFYCSLAGANYLSSILITVVQNTTGGEGRPGWLDNNINVGRVDYFYYLIAVMGAVNLLYFLVCAHFYRYKGTPEIKRQGAEI